MKISISPGEFVRSPGPIDTSDVIDPRVMQGNHAKSKSPQGTPDDKGLEAQGTARNLSWVYESPTSAVRCVGGCTQSEAEASKKEFAGTKVSMNMAAGVGARRHASTGDALPQLKEGPLTRWEKRHENFTDPVNAIMKE